MLLLTLLTCEQNWEGACDVDCLFWRQIMMMMLIIPQLAVRVTRFILR
jgi:hypothetical protein